jgi:enediyne biosynthesis thioesterase
MRCYEYVHVVGFDETNLLGNVYYAHLVRWQGRCREMFLRDHAPDVVAEFSRGLSLATTRCSCEFLQELGPFDEVAVRMRLGAASATALSIHFEYWRRTGGGEELVARGEQRVACLRREAGRTVPAPIPRSLRDALQPYSRTGEPV